METFTLVISVLLGGVVLHETKTPGLNWIECQLQATEVQKPKSAKCVPEDAPPAKTDPPVICPTWSPCWKNGKPVG